MDKKTIITIIIATILALVSAFLILNKNTTEKSVENVSTQQEETSTTKEDIVIDEEMFVKEVEQTEKTTETEKKSKPTKNMVKSQTSQTPVFDQIVVQEGSVVEEAEPDYGIRKVGDTVEITREFKVKSPVKYSFKDFGILDKVTTK